MRRIVVFGSAIAAMLILAVFVSIGWRGTAPVRPTTRPPVVQRHAPPPPAKPPAAAALKLPSFDIVTVDRHGQAVIAGRAEPGDRVRVLDSGKTIGEATADARGEWALAPQRPLAPGDRRLSLEAVGPPGGPARRSKDVVALSVAPPPSGQGGATAALAVLLPGEANRPVRVLQRAPSGGGLSLDTVEYGAGQRLVLSGHADPGARLNIYAGDRRLGTAVADAAGKWSLSAPPDRAIAGAGVLRLEELAAGGATVAHRLVAPFRPAAATAAAAPAVGSTYTVERGNSLWLIARRVYGHGIRYTAIYRANRDKIADPDLIYPGQRFKLPSR